MPADGLNLLKAERACRQLAWPSSEEMTWPSQFRMCFHGRFLSALASPVEQTFDAACAGQPANQPFASLAGWQLAACHRRYDCHRYQTNWSCEALMLVPWRVYCYDCYDFATRTMSSTRLFNTAFATSASFVLLFLWLCYIRQQGASLGSLDP